MATITVSLDDKSVIDAFNLLQAVSRNMTPAMEAVAGVLKHWTASNFAEQHDLTGEIGAVKAHGQKVRQ